MQKDMPLSLIFDMDGTLFQTNKILELSLEETFAYLTSLNEWSDETPIQKYREIMGVPLPIVWKTLLPDHSELIRQKANDFFQEKLIGNINIGAGALYPHVYLKKYNIEHAAVIGDRLSDINAAKNNGLMAVGCRFDFAQEDELAQADTTIDDLLELKTIFKVSTKITKNSLG